MVIRPGESVGDGCEGAGYGYEGVGMGVKV